MQYTGDKRHRQGRHHVICYSHIECHCDEYIYNVLFMCIILDQLKRSNFCCHGIIFAHFLIMRQINWVSGIISIWKIVQVFRWNWLQIYCTASLLEFRRYRRTSLMTGQHRHEHSAARRGKNEENHSNWSTYKRIHMWNSITGLIWNFHFHVYHRNLCD